MPSTLHKLPIYPKDHKVGMVVPKGGSSCKSCEYVSGQNCRQSLFVKWNGSNKIPAPVDSYCCDFYEDGGEALKNTPFENVGL